MTYTQKAATAKDAERRGDFQRASDLYYSAAEMAGWLGRPGRQRVYAAGARRCAESAARAARKEND